MKRPPKTPDELKAYERLVECLCGLCKVTYHHSEYFGRTKATIEQSDLVHDNAVIVVAQDIAYFFNQPLPYEYTARIGGMDLVMRNGLPVLTVLVYWYPWFPPASPPAPSSPHEEKK